MKDQICLDFKKIAENEVTPEYVESLREHAETGHVLAETELGYRYQFGLGFDENSSLAFYWMRKAAEKGYMCAQCQLSNMYELGITCTPDFVESVKWLRLAANQGCPEALYKLGEMYDQGKGVLPSFAVAFKCYLESVKQFARKSGLTDEELKRQQAKALSDVQRSAQQNDPEGLFNLAMTYFYGDHLEQDVSKAIELLRTASELGDPYAQRMLGELLFESEENQKEEGMKWIAKARDTLSAVEGGTSMLLN